MQLFVPIEIAFVGTLICMSGRVILLAEVMKVLSLRCRGVVPLPVDCTAKWYVVLGVRPVIVCEWLVTCAVESVVVWP